MGERRSAGPRVPRRTVWWVTGVLVGIAVLVLAAHLVLAWRLNTSHMQQRLEAAVAAGTDSLYRVRIGASRFSLLGRSFRITGFELFPDTAAFARRDKAGRPEHTRYRVAAGSLRVDGLGLWRFFRRQLSAGSASVDSLRLEIEVDRTKPRGPPTPATLPHQALQEAPPFRIDRLRIARSQILFTERALDGARFGRLPFTEIEATITNVSNDPTLVSFASPCEIDILARFSGASPMRARFEYDLTAKRLNMAYRVSFGRMPAAALNPFLVDLEGVRVREGVLDSADLKVVVRDDLARGELKLLYHDLEIETLDKVSRDRSLSAKVQTFIFNHFKLQSENPKKGKPALVAAVQYQRAPETPLFKFLWLTLRAGVSQTLGF
jgi:hypothetical protein